MLPAMKALGWQKRTLFLFLYVFNWVEEHCSAMSQHPQ